MKTLFAILMFCLLFNLKAQNQDTVFTQLYGIAGAYSEIKDGTSLSFTMGETITTTGENFEQVLTQGFHQPNYEPAFIIEKQNFDFALTAYPNPTNGVLNIEFEGDYMVSSQIIFNVRDIYGREVEVLAEVIMPQLYQIDLESYSTGYYLITIMDRYNSNNVNTLKVLKTN